MARKRDRREPQEGSQDARPEPSREDGGGMADAAVATKPSFAAVEEIPSMRRSGKSAELIDAFIEAGIARAQVTDHSKSFWVSLKRHVALYEPRVKVVTREGNATIYLERTDLDAEGNVPQTPEATTPNAAAPEASGEDEASGAEEDEGMFQ